MAELSNTQSRTLYSHLQGSVHKRSPKVHRRPDPKTIGKVYDMCRDKLFVTKCIALISQLPLNSAFEKILTCLYEAMISSSQGELDLPLESYIYNIIYEIPLPPPGRGMRFSVAGKTLLCQRPGKLQLIICINILN